MFDVACLLVRVFVHLDGLESGDVWLLGGSLRCIRPPGENLLEVNACRETLVMPESRMRQRHAQHISGVERLQWIFPEHGHQARSICANALARAESGGFAVRIALAPLAVHDRRGLHLCHVGLLPGEPMFPSMRLMHGGHREHGRGFTRLIVRRHSPRVPPLQHDVRVPQRR